MKSKKVSTRNYWKRLIRGVEGKDRSANKRKKKRR